MKQTSVWQLVEGATIAGTQITVLQVRFKIFSSKYVEMESASYLFIQPGIRQNCRKQTCGSIIYQE